MQIVTVDLETYWDKNVTSTKLSPIEYCHHPKFEVQSCATKINDGETVVTFGFDETKALFDTIDWSDSWVVGHNLAEFDVLILGGTGRQHFGLNPKRWGCTRAMARPLHAKDPDTRRPNGKKAGPLSLASLAAKYNLGLKGDLEAIETKGKRLSEFTADERAQMAVYNKQDVDLTYALFRRLLPHTTPDEARLIDLTIRMLINPRLEADTALLARGLRAEQGRKRKLIQRLAERLNLDPSCPDALEEVRAMCASAAKFKAILLDLGVEIPTKTSPTTGKEIPALAKTDQAMQDLQEHPNEDIQLLAQVRLGVRSTILETRLQRLIDASAAFGGKMPIPLRYYGADTTGRWSGTMSLNCQNLPRVNPRQMQISDVLRKGLRAPKGHQVVVADLSGIELRVNLTLWKVPYAMEAWGKDRKADLYKPLASEVLGVPLDEVTKEIRQAGKAMHLGCGYGLASPGKYILAAKSLAQIDVTADEAKIHISGYRNKHPEVVEGWQMCGEALTHIYNGEAMRIDPWGMCVTTKEGIRTPRGMIRYPALHKEGRDWYYGNGHTRAKIYSSKVDENIVQHLSRHVMTDAMLNYMRHPLGQRFPIVHTVHDEVIIVAEQTAAQDVLDCLQEFLRTPPTWWPELVTYSEGGFADNYGDVDK